MTKMAGWLIIRLLTYVSFFHERRNNTLWQLSYINVNISVAVCPVLVCSAVSRKKYSLKFKMKLVWLLILFCGKKTLDKYLRITLQQSTVLNSAGLYQNFNPHNSLRRTEPLVHSSPLGPLVFFVRRTRNCT